jgi:hypothetical protein
MSLEDLRWPEECMHNVDTFLKNNYMKEKEKKRKIVEIEFARTDEIARGEAHTSHPTRS